jgi:hypothetical protein
MLKENSTNCKKALFDEVSSGLIINIITGYQHYQTRESIQLFQTYLPNMGIKL